MMSQESMMKKKLENMHLKERITDIEKSLQ